MEAEGADFLMMIDVGQVSHGMRSAAPRVRLEVNAGL